MVKSKICKCVLSVFFLYCLSIDLSLSMDAAALVDLDPSRSSIATRSIPIPAPTPSVVVDIQFLDAQDIRPFTYDYVRRAENEGVEISMDEILNDCPGASSFLSRINRDVIISARKPEGRILNLVFGPQIARTRDGVIYWRG